MIRTIILDLDGPILDGIHRHYQCYNDILAEKGFVPMSIEKYWEMKRNRIDRREQLAVSGADEIYDYFLKTWLDRIEEKKYLLLDKLQPDVVEKIVEWRSAGIKIILVTMRNNEENLYWQLSQLHLLPLLDQIVAVGTDLDKADKASALGNCIDKDSSDSILWIGDTETDIYAARKLGVKICAVECGLRNYDHLVELNPALIVSNLMSVNLCAKEFM